MADLREQVARYVEARVPALLTAADTALADAQRAGDRAVVERCQEYRRDLEELSELAERVLTE